MNLFRSEEHVRRWELFNPKSEEAIRPLEDWVLMFNTESRRHLLDGDYLQRWLPKRGVERREILVRMGLTSPFFLAPPS